MYYEEETKMTISTAASITLEMVGTGTHNLGAMLMANAIAARVRDANPANRIVVGAGFGDAFARGALQLNLIDDVPGRVAGPYLRFSPRSVRQLLGIVRRREVCAVLDASGFAYSDAFGAAPAKHILQKLAQAERRGQKLILLPQAYGPFENPKVAELCRKLFHRADLIFARDQESLRMTNDLLGQEKAQLCPDITISLQSTESIPVKVQLPERFVAIVPNFRMQKRAADPDGMKYLQIMKQLINRLQDALVPVVIVLHSREEDVLLAQKLSKLANSAPILYDSNPIILKSVLGRAHFVIGSRFHALVSALSQGVPCLGLGWAHKYNWLFRDFGIGEDLLRVDDPDRALARMDVLLNEAANVELRARLTGRANSQKQQIEAMWGKTFAVIDAVVER